MNITFLRKLLCFVLLFVAVVSCGEDENPPLFNLLSTGQTNIDFQNNLVFSDDLNVYKYRNYYNGGGVAAGDVNNDGLPDLYFVSNQADNKLYINKGNFTFEDQTDRANVAGSKPWSTGVAMVDINHDGYLDIYVSNSGIGSEDERRNELFINNGDGTFHEAAEDYGLDHAGHTIQANFFDYDGDGDLDVYLLNNSNTSPVSFELSKNQRNEFDEFGGDKLLRNDDGYFNDVTEEAGIFSSDIGFSLSASVSDLNNDGYPDLYIANDFFERDYLYLNNGDGTFDEVLEEQMNSISAASMGADIADLTNDGWPDLYVADMLPLTDQRTKQITTFENWELFSEKQGYGYHWQVTRNTLHLNNGDSTYSEVGRLANVQATDWSWAVLMADYDMNGYNDILVTNGLIQDITNLDYIEEISTPDMVRSIVTEENVDFERLVEIIPSNPIPNIMFSNQGDLSFGNVGDQWGFEQPTFSSGAAWADLDNDGSLDLVINDINGPAKVYRNNVTQQYPDRYSLTVELEGSEMNPDAIGAEVEIWTNDIHQVREHYLQRGYQSSVEPGVYFGIAKASTVDSLIVRWPDGRISKETNINLPAQLNLRYKESSESRKPVKQNRPATIKSDVNQPLNLPEFVDITDSIGLNWKHQENNYNDFNREKLLLHMRSTEGPALCKGDINNDGLEDVYVGGARGQAGVLLVQTETNSFEISEQMAFQNDAISEDTDCTFFDANGDSLPDLYVTSGGNSFSTGSSALFDRLYINRGNGHFKKNESAMYPPGGFSTNSAVASTDFNQDGADDLVVTERLKLFEVGMPARVFLLQNDGNGNFEDVTSEWSADFSKIGMLTDVEEIDWNADGVQDLIFVGEWMPPTIFINEGNRFKRAPTNSSFNKPGFWNKVIVSDLDSDGRDDFVAGNLGLNTNFQVSDDTPLKLWIGDFQNNGMVDQFISRSINNEDKPYVLRHDFISVIPSLQEQFPDYQSYSDKSVQEIFSDQQLENSNQLEITSLEHIAVLNKATGPQVVKLPRRTQFSPVYGIWTDVSETTAAESKILTVGNFLEVKPMAGPYDAGYGTVSILKDGTEPELHSLSPGQSNFSIKGSAREIVEVVNSEGDQILIIARNNDTPKFYRIDHP